MDAHACLLACIVCWHDPHWPTVLIHRYDCLSIIRGGHIRAPYVGIVGRPGCERNEIGICMHALAFPISRQRPVHLTGHTPSLDVCAMTDSYDFDIYTDHFTSDPSLPNLRPAPRPKVAAETRAAPNGYIQLPMFV